MSLRLKVLPTKGQGGLNFAAPQSKITSQTKKEIFQNYDFPSESAQLLSKTNTGDLQNQLSDLLVKFNLLEQGQQKLQQQYKLQSDFIWQQQQNKNDLLNTQQIAEIKKTVQNILEQNKILSQNFQQQKVLQDLNQINLNINKHQSQITIILQDVDKLKQDVSKQNLKENNEPFIKQFQLFKDQLNSQVQQQFIKIQEELKNNLSESSLQQKIQQIQQQLIKINEDQNNSSQVNQQQQQLSLQQEQQKILSIQKELYDLKKKVEQLTQQNDKKTIDKKTLDLQTKQELMFHQNNPSNSKDLGCSSKDLIDSIKDMSNSGVYNENISKLLLAAHKSPEQKQNSGKRQFSNIEPTKKQQTIKKLQSDNRKLDTNISNCSSLNEINFTCFLCKIETSENVRQTSCGHVYHNNCYRKLLEKQISLQNGYVKCVCNQVLLQSDLLLDLKESYFKMQALLYCKKYSDFLKKCKNFEKCNQFWVNDNTILTDICPECNVDKTQAMRQQNYLINQQSNNQQSQLQKSQFNFQQQQQKYQYQQQPSQFNQYQQQKQIFSQDQQHEQKLADSSKQPQKKQVNIQQLKTQHPGIKIVGYTGPDKRQ